MNRSSMHWSSMFTRIAAVAENAFTESIRQPVHVVLLLGGCVLLAINPLFSTYTLEDDNLIMVELGLSTILIAGLLHCAFTATGVLGRELESQTAALVLAKPISPAEFLCGKYLGVLASLALACWAWLQVFLLTIRHRVMVRATDTVDMPVLLIGGGGFLFCVGFAFWRNYFDRRPFGSALSAALGVLFPVFLFAAFSLDKSWRWQSPFTDLEGQVLIAALLLFEALAIVGAFAVAVATRFGQVVNLTGCALLFLLGLTSDWFFSAAAERSWGARLVYGLTPNFQYLWLSDALLSGTPASLGYAGLASLYSGCLVVALLALAVALFRTRELR